MGCVSSKWATSPPSSPSPSHYHSPPPLLLLLGGGTGTAALRHHHHHGSSRSASSRKASSGFKKRGVEFGELEKIKEEENEEEEEEEEEEVESGRTRELNSSVKSEKKASSLGLRFGRYTTQAEHIAAGWPSWLSAVAGEAIDGWLPLKADSFEKLDKIGQGTYSNVYRARSKESGRVFALKKVRFDTFQPESVRFMAREIAILRKLDHPNIMKLEGLITNRLSCSLYLVFEYMEHDLSGLLSCPDIKFTDAQIKCYMQQLLRGVEHCHSRGIMHRDIKTSNILVNNDGILKIGDFGLANTISSRNRLAALTSRVVTLWYRPPELLLGATSYGGSVDLWSVGCVFAELFIGRPVLKGRTEVEQLHKIFKLCGSPHDDYWTKSNLPLTTMFKPQQPYTTSLRERCKELPRTAVNLLETFLSIDPLKRLTAASALDSEYFKTKPYASDPSLLPKYPPNKEIDAKVREDARRRKAGVRLRSSGTSKKNPRRAHQEPSSISKKAEGEERVKFVHGYVVRSKGATSSRDSVKSYDTMSEASQSTIVSQVDSIRSVPNGPTSGFNWTRSLRGEEEEKEDQYPFSRKLQQSCRGGGGGSGSKIQPNYSLAALLGEEDDLEPFSNNNVKQQQQPIRRSHTQILPNWSDYAFNDSQQNKR